MSNYNDEQEGGGYTFFDLVKYVILFGIFIYAIYLSFKCKGQFQFVDFMAAFCCSPCYVAYRLAVGC